MSNSYSNTLTPILFYKFQLKMYYISKFQELKARTVRFFDLSNVKMIIYKFVFPIQKHKCQIYVTYLQIYYLL